MLVYQRIYMVINGNKWKEMVINIVNYKWFYHSINEV